MTDNITNNDVINVADTEADVSEKIERENNDISMAEMISAVKRDYEEQIDALKAECAMLKYRRDDINAKKNDLKAKNDEYLNEYVTVKLFKDGDKYRDDVYVAVNGANCVIKRGEWVTIKRKFALVLDASEIQDMKTADMIACEQEKFAGESAKLG